MSDSDSRRWSSMVARAEAVLCTEACRDEHVDRTYDAARREKPEGWHYADEPRLRGIRGVVVAKALSRLEDGRIGNSWGEFAANVAGDALPDIDMGALFGLAWHLLGWIFRRAFEAFVRWAIAYLVRLVIDDIRQRIFGQYGTLEDPHAFVAAVLAIGVEP